MKEVHPKLVRDKFYEYWQAQMQKGLCTRIGGLEQITLTIFVEWMERHYVILARHNNTSEQEAGHD